MFLLQRRQAILTELASLNLAAPGGRPSYSIDGQAVDHTAYRLSLYQELQLIHRLLAAELPPTEEIERGESL